MTKQMFLIVLLLIVFGFIVSTFAQMYMYPRSVSLANTYATQSRGADVIGWNPANLGLLGNPSLSFHFGVLPLVPFPSLQINNSVFSPYWFNELFFTGGYLDDEKKELLLDYFPNNGLSVNYLIQARILGISFGRWAVGLSTEATGSAVIPKSLFHFIFYGNQFSESINISDTDLEMQSVISIALAHGREVNIPKVNEYVKKLTAGAAIKFLFGAGYIGFDKVNGSITTYQDKFILEGNLEGKYGVGGFGMAIDAGVAAVLNEKMTANLSLNNLFGFLNWGLVKAEKVQYSFYSEIYSESFTDEDLDSLLEEGVETDTTFSIENFNSNYPAYILLGFQYDLLSNLSIYANCKEYFSNDFASSTLPHISVACEYKPTSWLPIRMGFGLGGIEKFRWGIGTGLSFNHYSLDWGFSQTGGMFSHAKGFAFSFGQQITF